MDTKLLNGRVEGVFLGLSAGHILSTPCQQAVVTFAGFEGDRHAGITMRSNSRTARYPRNTMIRNSRQVSIVSIEELAAITSDLRIPEIQPEWLGANLLVSGIPALTHLPPGTRLYFSNRAALTVEGLNKPCSSSAKVLQDHYPEKDGLAQAFIDAAATRRGIVAWVERPGVIELGDTFEVVLPEPVVYPA
ncbi:MAG: MOSC domain-containing protein [Anaerolineaceae bacterium]|nr:MOSC domain-containing protein [Anaerolineaceae bacterium]